MIAKQIKGRGFRGLLEYVENKEEAERIGGNMSGRNPRELAAEFRFSRQLNPNVSRAVYHVSLSLGRREYLPDDTWNEIAERYLTGMNFNNNQYVVYRHSDKDNDHIHIVASRIRLNDGKCVHDGWDYKRSEVIVRQLEQEYNLEPVPSSHEKLERTASTGQHRRVEREQTEYNSGLRDAPPELPIKVKLQKIIDSATTDHPTMPKFIERLQKSGVEVRHGLTRNGKSKGISYKFSGQAFSGSHLGAAYTWPGLQKHKGVIYQDISPEQLAHNAAPIKEEENNNLPIDTNTIGATDSLLKHQQITSNIELEEANKRDIKIVKHLLQSGRPLEEIKQTINATLVERTPTDIRELVLLAASELQQEDQKQQRMQKKQPSLEL
ncbi:relaxase/mobilization nuclease family protein (plasmid) [Calothrix sp. NIES-4071]|nr:relaxase/mobilization nuclease family protein [Calothrix sp. NIES-4071]BAZ65210.1 relaxase/mobilization nuclease family protein [Calothrix sp. NIES-4105]